MTLIDLFDLQGPHTEAKYSNLGLPYNPFRTQSFPQQNPLPFYKDHLKKELEQVNAWVKEVIDGRPSALSLAGNIGVGKTHLIDFMCRRLRALPEDSKILADIALFSDAGYSRASIGRILVSVLERLEIPWAPPAEQGVIPIVWAILHGQRVTTTGQSPLEKALSAAQRSKQEDRFDRALLISRWLQRSPLKNQEQQRVGLFHKLDWEGELIREIARLLAFAKKAGSFSAFFLFIDQLEELFRPNFSDLRRSRLLTDLRVLVDEVDAGAPLGLLLAWTPDFKTQSRFQATVRDSMALQYPALLTRLDRRRVDLTFLRRQDARPFADVWIEAVEKDSAISKDKLRKLFIPRFDAIVDQAWTRLQKENALYRQTDATPRDLLRALAAEVDELAV